MKRKILIAIGVTSVVFAASIIGIARLTTDETFAGSAIPQVPVDGGKMIRLKGDFSLSEVRVFDDFPLYSLGPSFKGLELVALLRANASRVPNEPVRANYVNFVYGLCELEEGEEGGCQPPLQVQVWDACERHRGVYGDMRPDEELTLRGVPAAFFEQRTRLELYTDKATIVVYFVRPDRALLLEAADSLRGVNVDAALTETLPPPLSARSCR